MSYRKRIIPGPRSSIQLDKNALEVLIVRKKQAALSLNRFIKSYNKKISYQERELLLNKGVKLTIKGLLQGFMEACHNNSLHGKYLETSTALLVEYTDGSRSAVKRHIKKLKEADVIVDQIYNPENTYNNNYLVRLADWLIDDMYAIVEDANRKAREIEESRKAEEQKKQELEQAREQMAEAIDQVAEKAVKQVENVDEEFAEDTPEMWQEYLKKRFFDSG
jgi:DNA-binding transcriptional ArsR family regulator